MKKYNIAFMIGSIRQTSINLALAKALVKLGSDRFTATFTNIADLPLYSQDLDANFPAAAIRLKNEIQQADAILFVTPEYNRSIPGLLKNAIDWASRPYGQNAFVNKPAVICGASPGALGTACAQQHLKSVLLYLELHLLSQPEVYMHFKEGSIDADGNIHEERTQTFLQKFIDQFIAWIELHSR